MTDESIGQRPNTYAVMTKMKKKYSACITVDANINVKFEADDSLTIEQLKEIALDLAEQPTVCHQCSDEIEIGPILDCVEVVEVG